MRYILEDLPRYMMIVVCSTILVILVQISEEFNDLRLREKDNFQQINEAINSDFNSTINSVDSNISQYLCTIFGLLRRLYLEVK